MSRQQVVRIRELRSGGASCTELARKFSISTSAISAICTGRSYPDFEGPLTKTREGRGGPGPKPGASAPRIQPTSLAGGLGTVRHNRVADDPPRNLKLVVEPPGYPGIPDQILDALQDAFDDDLIVPKKEKCRRVRIRDTDDGKYIDGRLIVVRKDGTCSVNLTVSFDRFGICNTGMLQIVEGVKTMDIEAYMDNLSEDHGV